MPKQTTPADALPHAVQVQLRELGARLEIARKRRREPRRLWAERMGVSEPTLARLEKGDPSVAMGTYAMALWLMGGGHALSTLADPAQDVGALENDIRAAEARSKRRPVSLAARLEGRE
jgi:transcriptional regulator with XRE-family HTH domain